MKKTTLISTLFASALVLAACNNTDEEVSKDNSETSVQSPTGQQESTENNTVSGTEDTSSNESHQDDSTLSFSIGKTEYNEPFEMVTSSEQNFSVNLPSQFYLIEEEPGKDAIIYKDNEAIMMRVELLSKEEWSYEAALEDSQTVLEQSSKDGHYTPFEQLDYFDATAYKTINSFIVENESDKVIIVLLEKDDLIIRLTIFDDYVTDVTDAFLKIGSTIQ